MLQATAPHCKHLALHLLRLSILSLVQEGVGQIARGYQRVGMLGFPAPASSLRAPRAPSSPPQRSFLGASGIEPDCTRLSGCVSHVLGFTPPARSLTDACTRLTCGRSGAITPLLLLERPRVLSLVQPWPCMLLPSGSQHCSNLSKFPTSHNGDADLQASLRCECLLR